MSEPAPPQQIVIRLEIEVSPALLAAIAGLGQRLASFIVAPAGAPMADMVRCLPASPAPAVPERPAAAPAPVAAKNAAQAAGRYRTEARAALVRELWPAGVATREIARRLAALPGPPVPPPVNKRIGIWAAWLGVKRPEGTPNFFPKTAAPAPGKPAPAADGSEPEPDTAPRPDTASPAQLADAPAARDAAPAPPTPVAVPAKPVAPAKQAAAAPAAPTAGQTWSVERTALVRRDYPIARVRTDDLLAQINALPGAPISEMWLHNYAVTALKLSRRSDAPRQPDAPPAPAAVRRAVAREAIESWCRGRGWRFERFDIDAINRRCAAIGHPGFNLLEPSRRGAAA